MICLTCLVPLVGLAETSEASNNTFRFGLQGTHYLGGLSGIMEISDAWAFQGVLSFEVDAFAFRVLHRFHQREFWNAYGEGTAEVWSAKSHRPWGGWENSNPTHGESDIGLGTGVGIEYDWRGLNPSLPPIGWSIELGVNVVPNFYLDSGLGVHWKF